MSSQTRVACWAAVLTASLSLPTAAWAQAAAAPPKLNGRALLVGCTTYYHLPESVHLKGPGNDVVLMRSLLTSRFGMPAENVVVLAEAQGADALKPTRANIEREFKRLAELAQKDEQVVILLAGHGSQQPDQDPPSPADPEPDGLDEIFLPADVKAWDGSVGEVPNSIVDDQFRTWLAAIEAKGASVLIVMDACHSGTMTRGVEEQSRQILPDTLVPQAALDAAEARAKKAPKPADGSGSAIKLEAASSTVAIYAAQSTEVTVEKMLPPEGADRQRYGLLTYTMNQVLTQAEQPLTYAELVQRVHAQYVQWGRTFPTPLLEGARRDREVLGQRDWPGRSRILLTKSETGYAINAGTLHGVTQGSVLAVYGQGAEPVGHVRITKPRMTSSAVEPCAWELAQYVAELPTGARCETVFVDYGVDRLRIFLDPQDFDGKPVAAEQQAALARDFGSLVAKPGVAFTRTEDATTAQWVVRCQGAQVYLLPAGGWKPVDANDKRLAPFGPVPLAEAGKWLDESLPKIAKAEQLKRVAASTCNEVARSGDGASIEVTLEVKQPQAEQTKTMTWQADGLKVHDGDEVAYKIKNLGRAPVDVTLLYVDSDFGVTPLFPSDGELNRLASGESLTVKIEVNANPAGSEHLVVIATRGRGQPVNFVALAQPAIQGAQAQNRGGQNTPLGGLLENAMFAVGTTRGAKPVEVNEYAMKITTWTVLKRPEGGAK